MKLNLILLAHSVHATVFTYWASEDCSGNPLQTNVFPNESCQLLDISGKSFQLTDVDMSYAYVAGVDEDCSNNQNFITVVPSDDATPCVNYYKSAFISLKSTRALSKPRSVDTTIVRRDDPPPGTVVSFNVNGRDYVLRVVEVDTADRSRGPDSEVVGDMEQGVTLQAQDQAGTTATSLYYADTDALGVYVFDFEADQATGSYASDVPSNDWGGIMGQMFGLVGGGADRPLNWLFSLYSGPQDPANLLGQIHFNNPM